MTASALALRNPGLIGAMGGAMPLFDDFNRANSTSLGVTSIGGRPWQVLSGTWDIYSNRIRNTSGTDPVAVVDANAADVDITLNTSAGRDAIIFRASDANNWLRLSAYYNTTTSTYYDYCNTYTYIRSCSYAATSETPAYSISRSNCGSCPSCPSGSSSGSCSATSSVCNTYICGGPYTSTSTTRRVYLHKMQSGSLTQLNYWNTGTTSSLRVRALGSSISLYQNGSSIGSRTETFNQSADLHGIGRSALGNYTSSALDNFSLSPL